MRKLIWAASFALIPFIPLQAQLDGDLKPHLDYNSKSNPSELLDFRDPIYVLDSTLTIRYDSVWFNSGRSYFTQDANCYNNEIISQMYLILDSIYQNQFREERTNDANGNVTENILQVWNGDAWENQIRDTYEFDGSGDQIAQTRFEWNLDDQMWEQTIEFQFEHSYDGNDLLEKITTQANIGMGWILFQQRLYTYNAQDLVEQELTQKWKMNQSVWENQRALDYTYPTDSTETWQLRIWDNDMEVWNNSLFYHLTYDLEIEKLATRAIDTWDIDLQDWTPSTITTYFYSDKNATAIPYTVKPVLNCVFPNPITAGDGLYCDQLSPTKQYSLALYDLQGRQIVQQSFLGPQFFLESTVNTGLYIMVIKEGNEILSTQKLVIHN